MNKKIPIGFRKPHDEAIATDRGWMHSKTGELLVSHIGLRDKLEKFGLTETKDNTPVIDESPNSNVDIPPVETVTEEKVIDESPKKEEGELIVEAAPKSNPPAKKKTSAKKTTAKKKAVAKKATAKKKKASITK